MLFTCSVLNKLTQYLFSMHKIKGMTDSDRLLILEEYLSSSKSRYQIEKEKSLSRGSIRRWLCIFDLSDKSKSEKMNERNVPEESLVKENEALRLRIKSLERELKESNMARDVYDRMIDLAEERFSIPVRKNSVAK